VQRLNQYLREEYHQLQDILWKSGYSKLYADMPARRDNLHTEKDACRVHGTLTLNKVAGNFHVTAGKVHPLSHPFLLLLSYLCSTCSSKVLPIMGAHAHMTGFMEKGDYNFSHRIERLSFGEDHAGIIQPLEGDEKLTDISRNTDIAPWLMIILQI